MSNSETTKISAILERDFDAIVAQGDIGSWVIDGRTYQIVDIGSYSDGNVKAITVKDEYGNIFVHFNGTGEDNWAHNADSAYGDTYSKMQDWARQYLDNTLAVNYNGGDKIYVTGHSQGGNNALYAAIFSKYIDLIESVIVLDAPGFNDATLKEAKDIPGYYSLLLRTYAINGVNDYVHLFGENRIIDMISDENSYYIKTPNASDFEGYHHIDKFFEEGDKLNDWGDRGPVAQLVFELMENLNKDLLPEQRHEVAVIAMKLVEHFIGNKDPIEDMSLLNVVDAIRNLLPVIRETAIENPGKLWDVLLELGVDEMIAKWVKENPLIVGALVLVSPFVLPIVAGILADQVVAYLVDKLADVVKKIASDVKNFIINSFSHIKAAIENFNKWLNRAGIEYAASHTYIKVDTDKLLTYATRISYVNKRLGWLDNDLNDLYRQVELLDLLTILKANLLTSGSPTLSRVITYLSETAQRFESAENNAQSYMGG